VEMTTRTTPVVLVADDEPSMLALVARHIRTLGYEVLEASDGELAWQEAMRVLPDLVVLDVMMPGMSGWEVCRRIRENVGLAHTGVIMLTGIGQSLNELTSPLYGADAYVDKPFEFRDLDEKIAKVLTARGHTPIETEPSPSSADVLDDEQEDGTTHAEVDARQEPAAAAQIDDIEPPTLDLPGARAMASQNVTEAGLAGVDELAKLGQGKTDEEEEDEFSMALTLRPPPKHDAAVAPLPRPAPVAAIAIEDGVPEARGAGSSEKPAKKAVKKPAKKAAKKPAKKAAKKPAKKAVKKPAKKAAKKAVKKAVRKAAKKPGKKPVKKVRR